MKRLYVLILTAMLCSVAALARPGYSKPVQVKQPDGSFVTLLMRGDEYLSYMTTTDGYTVIRDADGFYCYAEQNGTSLQSTGVVACDPEARQEQEKTFLSGRPKHLHGALTEEAKARKAQASEMLSDAYAQAQPDARRAVSIWSRINYSNFKGLVVLVEFNDRQFRTSNPASFYQRLTSEKNLTDTSHEYYPVDVTGSTRDYFYANSMGIFDPTFDVIGPVQIEYSCTYPCPKTETGEDSSGYSERLVKILRAVMTKANNIVDFNDYDLNNDGVIDMVYLIFAGYGSYVQGNSYKYIWPHANDFTSYAKYMGWKYDGKYMGRYACSTEIQDNESYASQHVWLDGVGTMCHEFSHVLGLADHYDTDYEENGQSQDPGGWDIMASGADYNYGLTPVGYNAFERHILGFTEPQKLDVAGSYELDAFNTGNKSYILATGTTNDDFYLENRQKQGWDAFLPASGLLVWRAETTNSYVWKNNTPNANANHNYFQLLRSVPGKTLESAYTPFPGAGNVIDVTSTTDPALLSWAGKEAVLDLYDISENDGVISFTAGKNLYEEAVENFETMAVTTADAKAQPGVFCSWDLNNATISAVDGELGNGSQVAVLNRTGDITATSDKPIRKMSFSVWTGGYQVKVSVRTYQDGKWTILETADGQQQVTLAKNSGPTTFNYTAEIPAGTPFQVRMLATSTKAVAYVDDIKVSLGKAGTDGIQTVRQSEAASSAAYSLSGKAVDASYKGVVLQNGKKTLKK